jgi:hypothetical protein
MCECARRVEERIVEERMAMNTIRPLQDRVIVRRLQNAASVAGLMLTTPQADHGDF